MVNLPQAQFRFGVQRGNQRSQQQHQGQIGGYHHQYQHQQVHHEDDQTAEENEQQGLSLVEEDAMDVEFRDAPVCNSARVFVSCAFFLSFFLSCAHFVLILILILLS